MTYRFPAADRVRRRSSYQRIQRNGRPVHTRDFLIVVSPGSGSGTRLGITVTRKVDRRAVCRNRIKRVVREVFRQNRPLFPAADLVFIAKRGAGDCDYESLLRQVQSSHRALVAATRAQAHVKPEPQVTVRGG